VSAAAEQGAAARKPPLLLQSFRIVSQSRKGGGASQKGCFANVRDIEQISDRLRTVACIYQDYDCLAGRSDIGEACGELSGEMIDKLLGWVQKCP